ncbi:glycosyltransferase [Niabella hirudinis]|uniref:glycosyltransferase n=1 Tax=Niabella hirudinis TaxID=1285929 RepID=UPI003EB7F5D7
MIKILFILPSLKAGGAERVISFIAQRLDKKVFDVTLLIQGHRKDQVFDVKNINVTFLEKPRLINAIPDIFQFIRNWRPNIVVGSIIHVNLLLGFFSFFFPKILFIGREASVGSVMGNFSDRKQLPSFIKKILYRQLDAIICQSQDMKKDFDNRYRPGINKSLVISNPVTIESFSSSRRERTVNAIKFITVGRLSKEKGHERLLHIMKNIKISFEYLLIGDGPEILKIEALIDELNLKKCVKIVHHTTAVQQYLSESDFFLQGSYVEGFPNALLEAVSMGVPVIAFNAPGGTREIIIDGTNGLLANDASEFETAIQKALKTEWNAAQISEDARLRFGPASIVKKYETLFITLLRKNIHEK